MFRRRSAAALLGSGAFCFTMATAGVAQADSVTAEDQARICGGYPAPALPALETVPAQEGISDVSTPFGDVSLPTAPRAALGMYTTDVDILIWLGFPLAERQPIRGDNGYEDFPCYFPQEPLEDIEPFASYPEYNYEQILLAEPDFILNGLGYDDDVVDRLPQIAPTYSLNAFDGQSWQTHFKQTATALDRLDRYEAWLAIYETRLAEVRELIEAHLDAVVTPLGYLNGVYYAGCGARIQCIVFEDLGLPIFEGAQANDGRGVELSAEMVDQLSDVDFAFTTVGVGASDGLSSESLFPEAAGNPLWENLEFVRHGQIVPFELDMIYGSPSGQLAFLEVIAQALGD